MKHLIRAGETAEANELYHAKSQGLPSPQLQKMSIQYEMYPMQYKLIVLYENMKKVFNFHHENCQSIKLPSRTYVCLFSQSHRSIKHTSQSLRSNKQSIIFHF